MKNRSSSRPTASASARHTSKAAPLTQSGKLAPRRQPPHNRRTGPDAARVERPSTFCRARSRATSCGRSTARARPSASTRRGPAAAAEGSASSAAPARRWRPAGTTVSLLSSSTSSASRGADAHVVRRARSPRCRAARSRSRPRRHGPRDARRVVARRVVHHDHAGAGVAGGASRIDTRQRAQVVSRVVADDDDVETGGHGVSGRSAGAPRRSRAPRGPSEYAPRPRRAGRGGASACHASSAEQPGDCVGECQASRGGST